MGCRAMDKRVLELAGGLVVVTALAAEPGGRYRAATDNGVRHLRALGATVAGAPDVREDPAGALSALGAARLVVLPGGSPSRLLTALRTTPVGQLLIDLVAAGGTVMGASAGAMVLGSWTVLPDRPGPSGMAVVEGLGLVDVLVIPHWSGGSSRADWLRAVRQGMPGAVPVLGLPEESGVLVEDGKVTAVGQAPTALVNEERDLPLGETWELQ
ncbi:MAG: hypothetical protein JWO12_1553 [Frankiales bacterium]|nr:hypothetical protein [Frankiales bacterium]